MNLADAIRPVGEVHLTVVAGSVSAEDYHAWASGRPMPEIAAKVTEFMGKR